jgi:hypothetical protein
LRKPQGDRLKLLLALVRSILRFDPLSHKLVAILCYTKPPAEASDRIVAVRVLRFVPKLETDTAADLSPGAYCS